MPSNLLNFFFKLPAKQLINWNSFVIKKDNGWRVSEVAEGDLDEG